MFGWVVAAADAVAIVVLTVALFYPRHKRGDLVVAYLALNVGILAVSAVLSKAVVAAGLGLGIFGVLSIIRLRSRELDQHEIAYYFSSLALGLIGGLGASMGWLSLAFMAVIVIVVGVADSPRVLGRFSSQTVVLDYVATDSAALKTDLEEIVGGRVTSYIIRRKDLVKGVTVVDVRFQANPVPTAPLPRFDQNGPTDGMMGEGA